MQLFHLLGLYCREEVLREQFGIRLSRPISTASVSQANAPEEPQEISPEFLAALPADMQREVSKCFSY